MKFKKPMLLITRFVKTLVLLLIFLSGFSFAEDMDDVDVENSEPAFEQNEDDFDEPEEQEELELEEREEPEEREEFEEPEVDEEQDDSYVEESYEPENSYVEDVNPREAGAEYRNSYQDINGADRPSHKNNNKASRASVKYQADQERPVTQESKILISKKNSDPSNTEFECDPIVSVQVQNKKRFDILKELADEHAFEITMLESENKNMSLEKNLPLSKVIESITRDMSVVLNFRNEKGCKILTSIAVLDNAGWDSGSGSSYRSSNSSQSDNSEKLQRYQPKLRISPKLVAIDEEDKEIVDPEVEEARQALQEERRAKRLERKNMKSLNDEIDGGDELKTQFNVKGDNWKKDIADEPDIPDMQQYVKEVMNGDRQADMRSMSTRQRSEYMKVRRELRLQQKQ